MHQALYRMYRPKTFEEVYGQDHIIPILQNQIKTGNISHAYLFTGPRGTGKTSTARLFATTLNGGSEMDTIELDAASHNGVDDIRDIADKLSLTPFEGKYKIYILDEAHMLSTSASNAFLKILEEPPEHVIFILATTEPGKLPATVLSRTQRFDFNKITIETIIKRLKVVLTEEKITYEEEALELIARKSNGGLRDALTMLDKAIAFGDLTLSNVTISLGSLQSDSQLRLLHTIVDNDTPKALQLLEETRLKGIDPKVLLMDLLELLRDIIFFQNGVQINHEFISEASAILTDKQAAFVIEEISRTLGAIRYSSNPEAQLMSEIVILTNTNFENIEAYRNLPSIVKSQLSEQRLEIQELRREINNLESKLKNIGSYPQNPVDNSAVFVDNHQNSTISNSSIKYDLSTVQDNAEISPASIADLKNTALSPEEQAQLDRVVNLFPQLKERLKAIHRIQIFSVLSMAKPARYLNGNLFFLFSNESKKLIQQMQTTNPNEFVDPILSELMGNKIVTRYITDDELADFKEDDWQELIDNIENTFPGINLKIQ